MVKACCVKTCRVEWSPLCPFSFFSVPMKNEVLFDKWKEAIPNSKLGKYSSVCSKHFLPNEIQRLGAKTMLVKNAVPSVFIKDQKSQLTALHDHTYLGTVDSVIPMMNFSQNTNDTHESCTLMRIFMQNSAAENLKPNMQERPRKKDASVQTSPHRVGPTQREVQLQRKIKILQAKLRRREKRIASTRELLEHLKHSGKSTESLEEVLLKNFSGMNLELFQNQINNNNNEKNHRTYTPKMKEFASTLYLYSPPAYCFIRKNLNLPHPATLRKWTCNIVPKTSREENDAEVKEANAMDAVEVAKSARSGKSAAKKPRGKKTAPIADPEVEENGFEEFLEEATSEPEEPGGLIHEKRIKTAAKDLRGIKAALHLRDEKNDESDADEDSDQTVWLKVESYQDGVEDVCESESLEFESYEDDPEDRADSEMLEFESYDDEAGEPGNSEALEAESYRDRDEEIAGSEQVHWTAEEYIEDNSVTDSQQYCDLEAL